MHYPEFQRTKADFQYDCKQTGIAFARSRSLDGDRVHTRLIRAEWELKANDSADMSLSDRQTPKRCCEPELLAVHAAWQAAEGRPLTN
jgi:hypothetical protein